LQFSPLVFDQQKDLAFVRVGGVGDTWANLLARIPPVTLPSEANTTTEVTGAKVLYRLTQPVGAWQSGPILLPSNETDWTASTQLTDLYPSTQYEYRLVLPQASTTVFHPLFQSAQRFTTWSDPRLASIRNGAGTHFKFAATSCMIPYWPYVPFRFGKSRLRMKGVEHLAEGIKAKSIEFLLFLGDAIYVDVPFYTGPKLETYLRKYRQVYASDSFRKVYEQIPTLHM
jgi:alkaline phosphatase D